MKPLLFALALFMAAPVTAQSTPRAAAPVYDPATVETLRGVVRGANLQPARYGANAGVHLTLATDSATVVVHLGPAWYLDHQDEQIVAGDEVVVVGSRVPLSGTSVIVAREVRRGEAVLLLRDAAGVPLWRGWRSGARRGL